MASLTDRDVRRARTASLLLAWQGRRSVAEVAEWFGAMQAQDYASALWSFGVRLPGATVSDVQAAVESGSVLRTWPMRGTLHFVASPDARWLLETTGARHLQARPLGARWQRLGLDQATADLALATLGRVLEGRRLTRERVLAALLEAGIDVGGQRGYHLLWFCAQRGLTCLGPNEDGEQTFVLLDQWAPAQRSLSGDAALGELALRYFQSHGPTTRQDFAGWAGITAAEARAGIARAGARLGSAEHRGREVWMAADLLDRAADVVAGSDRGSVRLLPGFDEYLLGFKDRSLAVPEEYSGRIVPGNNGVFQPTIVRDGRVLGTWRRSVGRGRVAIAATTFEPVSPTLVRGIERAATRVAAFLGMRPEVSVT